MKKLLAGLLAGVMLLAMAPAALAEGSEIHAANYKELNDGLKYAETHPGTTIILEGKDYIYEDANEEGFGYGVAEAEDLTIRGTDNTRMLCPGDAVTVFTVNKCTITLENLTLGHVLEPGEPISTYSGYCGGEANVIDVYDSTMTIKNCDLFGCGWTGLVTWNSTVTVDNSVIHDCSSSIVDANMDSKVSFTGCKFSGNGYVQDLQDENLAWVKDMASDYALSHPGGSIYAATDTSSVSLTNCEFTNNRTPHFAEESLAVTLKNCTFSNNAWPASEYERLNGAPATPPAAIAYASTQRVDVDGQSVEFQCYALKDANGNDTNYIKLRDLAQALNGTPAQFQVGWDGAVTIATKTAYTPNGSEGNTPFSGNRPYTRPTAETKVDGVVASLDAIVLTDDSGGGFTYYKLRDLGAALGFNVGWSAERGIFVETH